MKSEFVYDERLGIRIPRLVREWEQYSSEERSRLLREWEEIRGTIPDRIQALERSIAEKQDRLSMEDSFPESCRLNSAIAELASIINDLNLWFRTHQDMDVNRPHG